MEGSRASRERRSRLTVVALAALLWLPSPAVAQFGHPLKGQWSGEWGPPDRPTRLLLDLDWDGKAVTGRINPGPNAAVVRSVAIDYSKVTSWAVRIEAEGKDASGKPVPIVIDGTLENLGSYNRLFHGVWMEGGRKGGFTVTRN
jgi:hypothetical protein